MVGFAGGKIIVTILENFFGELCCGEGDSLNIKQMVFQDDRFGF